jgi:hypothetical protein
MSAEGLRCEAPPRRSYPEGEFTAYLAKLVVYLPIAACAFHGGVSFASSG